MRQVPLLWRLRVIHKKQKTSRRPTTRRYLPILTNLPNHAFRDTNKFVQPSQIIIVTHKSSLHSTIIHSYTILYTPYYLCSFNDSLYRLFVRVKRHCYYRPYIKHTRTSTNFSPHQLSETQDSHISHS